MLTGGGWRCGAQLKGDESLGLRRCDCSGGATFETVQSLRPLLAPAMQQVGVHAVLLGYRSDRYTGLVAHGHQCGLELRGIGAVRAPLRVPRGLRVFEHRVHVLVACTRSSSDRLSHSRWGSPGAYIQDGFATRLQMTAVSDVRIEGVFLT